MKSIYLKSRDNARTPMPWSQAENAGFTKGTPWIKLNPNYKEINVQDTLRDKNSVFYYYQKLISLRHTLPIITNGKYVLLDKDNESTYSYLRESDKQVLFVAGNFTADKQIVQVPSSLREKDSQLIISNYETVENNNSTQIELPSYGAAVYLYDKNKKLTER
jgi:Glycosidases